MVGLIWMTVKPASVIYLAQRDNSLFIYRALGSDGKYFHARLRRKTQHYPDSLLNLFLSMPVCVGHGDFRKLLEVCLEYLIIVCCLSGDRVNICPGWRRAGLSDSFVWMKLHLWFTSICSVLMWLSHQLSCLISWSVVYSWVAFLFSFQSSSSWPLRLVSLSVITDSLLLGSLVSTAGS